MSSLSIGRFAALLLAMLSADVAAVDVERTGGPYVPTPQAVVDAMLELAKVGPRDFVIDLGSGDGRIVLTAAQRYSARGLGVDIDPELVDQSNAEAQRRGLADRVSFRQQDGLHRLRLTTSAFLRGVALGAPASGQPRHAVPIRPVSRR